MTGNEVRKKEKNLFSFLSYTFRFQWCYLEISNLVHLCGRTAVHIRGMYVIGNLIFLLSSNTAMPNLHSMCQLDTLGSPTAASTEEMKMNKQERVISFLFFYHNKNYSIERVATGKFYLKDEAILKENNSFTNLLKCPLEFINELSTQTQNESTLQNCVLGHFICLLVYCI